MRYFSGRQWVGSACAAAVFTVALSAAVSAGAVSAGAVPADAAAVDAAADPPEPAMTCVTEPYTWFGQLTLASGEFVTVAEIPAAAPGTWLRVAAMDVSPGALTISVGGAPVGNGSNVEGGMIEAGNAGLEPLIANSIALNVDRCSQVEVAAAAPVRSAPKARPASAGLPETGSTSLPIVLSALVLTVSGFGLRHLSRRRAG